MKLLFSAILFFLSVNLSGQLMIDTEYFYLKAVFDDLPIYDEDGKEISDQELLKILYEIDVYSGMIFEHRTEYFTNLVSNFTYPSDTYTYQKYPYLKFCKSIEPQITEIYISILNDETGEFLKDKKMCFINSKLLHDLDTIHIIPNKKDILEKIHGTWSIHLIKHRGEEIALDSCLVNYRIKFTRGQNFSHRYNNGNKCGLVDLDNSSYKHHLSYTNGFWKISDNDLIFVDTAFKNFKRWKYQVIGNDTLQLTSNKYYTITFTKDKS